MPLTTCASGISALRRPPGSCATPKGEEKRGGAGGLGMLRLCGFQPLEDFDPPLPPPVEPKAQPPTRLHVFSELPPVHGRRPPHVDVAILHTHVDRQAGKLLLTPSRRRSTSPPASSEPRPRRLYAQHPRRVGRDLLRRPSSPGASCPAGLSRLFKSITRRHAGKDHIHA